MFPSTDIGHRARILFLDSYLSCWKGWILGAISRERYFRLACVKVIDQACSRAGGISAVLTRDREKIDFFNFLSIRLVLSIR